MQVLLCIKLLLLQVGSTPGADFTSNWWDKVFDSAASNLRVKDNSEVGGATTGLGTVWQNRFFGGLWVVE